MLANRNDTYAGQQTKGKLGCKSLQMAQNYFSAVKYSHTIGFACCIHFELGLQVKRMLRGAREEEAKLRRRRSRSNSFAESGGGRSEEEEGDGLEERSRGLSRSLEASPSTILNIHTRLHLLRSYTTSSLSDLATLRTS